MLKLKEHIDTIFRTRFAGNIYLVETKTIPTTFLNRILAFKNEEYHAENNSILLDSFSISYIGYRIT